MWFVCELGLCLSYPDPIFESAKQKAKTFGATEVEDRQDEVALMVHQFELLLKLRNMHSYKNVDDAVLFEAAEALIAYGHDLSGALTAMLLSTLSNPAYYGATRLLTRFGWDDAIDLLIGVVDGRSSRSQSALLALAEIGDAAVPALCRALNNKDWSTRSPAVDRDIRKQIAWALGQIRDKISIDALVLALSDVHHNVRGQAAWALGQIGNVAALDALVEVLNNDGEAKVRRRAAEALGQIGTTTAVEVLTEALSDENRYVRFYAESALTRIGSREATLALEIFKKNNR